MMKSKVKRLLVQCGVEPSMKGYDYLVSAIMLEAENKHDGNSPLKITYIYEKVAKRYNATPANVERCIRTAIRSAFAIYPPMLQNFFIGIIKPTGVVTNKAFICCIADRVLEGFKVIKSPDQMLEEGWCDDCSGSYYHCKLEDKCAGYGGTDEALV